MEHMPDKSNNQTVKFEQSFIVLESFIKDWVKIIRSQSLKDDICRTAWFVWGRYTLSIQAIHKICRPNFLPDIWLIARSCLEHEATLRGIMDDPKIANDYLNFADKAKAYYAWLLEKFGRRDQLAHLEPELINKFGANWRNKKATTWSKASELVEKYGGEDSRCCYAMWSHFTHCSVIAAKMLERTVPSQTDLDYTIATVYTAYVFVTKDFLDLIWDSIVTTESNRCKNDFFNVVREWDI